MRKTILTCDKCEKEVDELSVPSIKMSAGKFEFLHEQSSMDLCKVCFNDLESKIRKVMQESGAFYSNIEEEDDDDFPMDFFNKSVARLSEFD